MLTLIAILALVVLFGFAVAGAYHFWQGEGFFNFACSMWCFNAASDLFGAIIQIVVQSIEEAAN